MLTRDLVRLTIVFGVYGGITTVLFVAFAAPDVALSAAVVGGVAFPLLLAVTIAREKDRER